MTFKVGAKVLLNSYTPAKQARIIDKGIRGQFRGWWLCEDKHGMREWQPESGIKLYSD
jgi:hypothetical protein